MSELKYDKRKFLNNLAYLMVNKKKRIGEVETACGVSAGYFSRLKNDTNNDVCPNIQALYALCEQLDVTLDLLLNGDFVNLTEEELYLVNFADTITKKTIENKLDWTLLYKERFLAIGSRHPLIQVEDRAPADVPQVMNENVFCTFFTNKSYDLIDDVCSLTYGKIGTFLIFKLKEWDINGEPESEKPVYELYLMKDDEAHKVMNGTFQSKKGIYTAIENLYNAARASCKDLRLEKEVKEDLQKVLDSIDLPF